MHLLLVAAIKSPWQHLAGICNLLSDTLPDTVLFVKCLLGMLQAHHLYGDTGLTVDQPTSPGFTGASTCCLCPSCCCSRQCWPVPWHCGLDCSCCSCAEKLEKDSWLHAHECTVCDCQLITISTSTMHMAAFEP